MCVRTFLFCIYRKAKITDVEREYRKKVSCVPWDLLRRAFLQLSSSPEAFLVLRSHFLRTLAALSMCQYILGIGDRHLSNFMVDLESGGLIGIDFGHNFGTATQVTSVCIMVFFLFGVSCGFCALRVVCHGFSITWSK